VITGEKFASGVGLAMTRYRDYNIPEGDLPVVLDQILEPAEIPVFTNEHLHELVTSTENDKAGSSLADELKADMKGMRVDPIVGRYTISDAVKRALAGTGCKYELVGDRAVYVFCHNHLELSLD